jgi:hypothetical protein
MFYNIPGILVDATFSGFLDVDGVLVTLVVVVGGVVTDVELAT